MAAPWEKYGGAPAKAGATPSAPMVVGTPRPEKPRLPSPQTAAQAEKDRIEAERAALALKADQRSQANPAMDASVEQGKAAGFMSRATKANDIYGTIGAPPRSFGSQVAQNLFPNAVNLVDPTNLQMAESVMRDFIAATLRYESGASLPEAELATQKRIYFPMAGDDPATIKLKAQLRTNAIEALRLGAGPAAAQVPMGGGEVQFNDQKPETVTGPRLSPEDEQAYYALIATRPSPAQIQAFFAERHVGVGNAQEIADALGKGAQPGTGIDYSQVDADARAAAEAEVARNPGLGDTAELVGQGMGLGLTDEAAGIGRGLSRLVQGRNPIEGYQLGKNAQLLRLEQARENTGAAGTALEIGGGFLSANPTAAIAPATSRFDLIANGAKAGATGGGIAGFGYGNGLEDSVTKGVIGAGAGAVLGGGLSALSRAGAPRGADPELAAAAERQGVTYSAAHARPTSRNKLAGLESSTGSSKTVQNALAQTGDELETAVGRLRGEGTSLTTDMAGEAVQGAGRRAIELTGKKAKSLYRIAERQAGNVTLEAKQALTVLDDELAELAQNPKVNQGEIAFLNELRSDLSGAKTVEAIRNLRTSLRGRISEKSLTATQAEARASRVIDAATKDVVAAVPSSAGRAYERADAFYRQRMTYINDVVKKFTGPKDNPLSGEKAFARIQAMASPRGDGRRLGEMMRALTPEERGDVAATIAEGLGRKSANEPFSAERFVTQVERLSKSARRTVFGPEGSAALDDLLIVAQRHRDVLKSLNASRSGQVVNWRQAIQGIVLGGGMGGVAGGATGAAAGTGIAAGLSLGGSAWRGVSARLFMSKGFAKWVAQAPGTSNPAAIQNHIRRLGEIASREPAIAGELSQLQQMLTKQLTVPVTASDAKPDEKKQGR